MPGHTGPRDWSIPTCSLARVHLGESREPIGLSAYITELKATIAASVAQKLMTIGSLTQVRSIARVLTAKGRFNYRLVNNAKDFSERTRPFAPAPLFRSICK